MDFGIENPTNFKLLVPGKMDEAECIFWMNSADRPLDRFGHIQRSQWQKAKKLLLSFTEQQSGSCTKRSLLCISTPLHILKPSHETITGYSSRNVELAPEPSGSSTALNFWAFFFYNHINGSRLSVADPVSAHKIYISVIVHFLLKKLCKCAKSVKTGEDWNYQTKGRTIQPFHWKPNLVRVQIEKPTKVITGISQNLFLWERYENGSYVHY